LQTAQIVVCIEGTHDFHQWKHSVAGADVTITIN